MLTKEDLREARSIKVAIEGKAERLQQLRSLAESVTTQFSSTPGGGGDPQHMAKTIETIVDFSREIATDAALLVERQRKIQQAINKMDNHNCRTVLELYYLNGWRWDEVARKMNFSERHVYRLHSEALRQYERWQ